MNQTITVKIPASNNGAPGVFSMAAQYKVFSCLSTDGSYTAQSKHSDVPFDIDQPGRGFGSNNGKAYGMIILSNATNAIITSKIYLGDSVLPQSVIANQINATANITATAIATQQKLVTSAGAPVQWDAAITFVQAKILAFKTLDGGANAGNVSIGASAAHQPMVLAPGDEVNIVAPATYKLRMQDWYMNPVNAGDGIVIIYS